MGYIGYIGFLNFLEKNKKIPSSYFLNFFKNFSFSDITDIT